MQKVVPHLWFDTQAKEASEFYVSLFPDSKMTSVTALHGTPSGDCDIVSFRLWGHDFMAISAGPFFNINPSVSFMVNFDPAQDKEAATRIDEVWAKLIDGGKALMPIGEYPFSKRYGWVQDKYGLSWQLMLTNPDGEMRPTIIPSIMFVGDNSGKAEEATDFYLSIFKDAKRGMIARYPAGMNPDKEGSIMFTDFMLEGQWFAAMDSAQKHDFVFNEAVSFLVNCDTQEEIDYYWEKLSAVPEAEQCGWLKDKYGLSWQVSPSALNEMMSNGTPAQIDRVTKAFLAMKKFDLAKLEEVYAASLILTSSFNTVVNELREKLLIPAEAVVGFIPTAGDPYPEKPWVDADRDALLALGYQIVDVDLKNKTGDELKGELDSVDIIFVAGGNTSFLAHHAHRSHFGGVVRDLLKQGKLYIGSSAGSILAGPTVEPFLQSDLAELSGLVLDASPCLQLVDYVVLPHDQVPVFAAEHDNVVKAYSDRFTFVRLTDDEYRYV